MNIDVSGVFHGIESVLSVDCSLSLEYLGGYFDNIDFCEPINIKGAFKNVGSKLSFIGDITVKFLACCDRCLKNVHFDFTIHVSELFVNSFDDDAIYFDGNFVDIGECAINNIMLNLPMKVLCSDDCKGLCTVCGANFNDGDCNCDKSYFNPHFESLRFLFNEM